LTGSLLLASCEQWFAREDREYYRAARSGLAKDFQRHAEEATAVEKQFPGAKPAGKLPEGFTPWWAKPVGEKLFADSRPAPQRLDDLFARAMASSSQIKVFSDLPLIRETGIREARGEFDTHWYSEGHYGFTNEPVGSLLDTGRPGTSFYRRWEEHLEAGIKKKYVTGAEVKLSQEFTRINDNSIFREPNPQAYAKLGLTVIQPLLKGAGCKYNRSYIRIAKVDTEIARSEFLRQSESHLMEVCRSYWNLYLARSLAIQKRKLVDESEKVAGMLDKRKDIDAMDVQLQRTRSALANRKVGVVRAETAIRNAEDRIRALVNDPNLFNSAAVEIIPAEAPQLAEFALDAKAVATAAIDHRPEIDQAFLQIKAAGIRKEMAENEMLPQLDLILETAIAGLDSAGCLTNGYDEQWRSHPGFLIGFKFDYPCENNSAKARLQRRKLENRQLLSQLQTTVDTVLLEVKVSVREVTTAYREMFARFESLQAAQKDLEVLWKRWEGQAGAQGASGYLDLLVDSQDRLASAEEEFARSQVIYNVAMLNLQRAQGTLLTYENVEVVRVEPKKHGELPELKLEKKAQ
jgi:outer membrane protein TolC